MEKVANMLPRDREPTKEEKLRIRESFIMDLITDPSDALFYHRFPELAPFPEVATHNLKPKAESMCIAPIRKSQTNTDALDSNNRREEAKLSNDTSVPKPPITGILTPAEQVSIQATQTITIRVSTSDKSNTGAPAAMFEISVPNAAQSVMFTYDLTKKSLATTIAMDNNCTPTKPSNINNIRRQLSHTHRKKNNFTDDDEIWDPEESNSGYAKYQPSYAQLQRTNSIVDSHNIDNSETQFNSPMLRTAAKKKGRSSNQLSVEPTHRDEL